MYHLHTGSAIQVNIRSKSGIVPHPGNDNDNANVPDVPITWDEAFSQSVKRVVVNRPLDTSGQRHVVKLDPVIPNVPMPTPPPHEQVARMARFIVHNSSEIKY